MIKMPKRPTINHRIVKWLNSLQQVSDVQPITVTIKGTRYIGASYRDDIFGGKLRLYLLGRLPACYRRSTRTVFVIDNADWYIASYMRADRLNAENKRYHPFGEMFMLCRWQVSDGSAIDRWELRPYNRVAARVDR